MNPIQAQEIQLGAKPQSTASPIKKWLHHNPTVQKTLLFALAVLGIRTFCKGIYYFSRTSVYCGAALMASAYLLKKMTPYFLPMTINTQKHAFTPQRCRGVTLKYEGDLPVLTIPKEVAPLDAGFARGYMMAGQIKEILARNDFGFHTLRGFPRDIPFLIDKIKKAIPPAYIQEMEGIVQGYHAKRESWIFLKGDPLTLDKLIYFHLLPDYGHLDFGDANYYWSRHELKDPMGCSVVVDGTEATGPMVMRTVDWTSLGVYGTYSLVEKREISSGMRTVGQSFPLFVGYITAMNERGLFGAINVTRGLTDYPEYTPSVFYLRKLIESCHTIRGLQGAETFWQSNLPLGPFNLTLSDGDDAVAVHFFQKSDRTHHVRWWTPGKELITLNFRYGEQGPTNPTASNSVQREHEINDAFRQAREDGSRETNIETRLKRILKGPEVNNYRTISAAFIRPRKLMFQTSFDNGYAGDRALSEISFEWFTQGI